MTDAEKRNRRDDESVDQYSDRGHCPSQAQNDATLTLETKQGRAEIKLAELESGRSKLVLDGHVEARRVPTYAPLASGPEGGSPRPRGWQRKRRVAILAHEARGPASGGSPRARPANFKNYVPSGGGDRIELIHYD